jgi:tetratricopeptide (TPR) repeat protein
MAQEDFDPHASWEALMREGELAQAQLLLEAWYAREPWRHDVLLRLAVVHWLAGAPARTLRALDTFLAVEPEHAEALARRAQALLALGKVVDAEVSLARAEALDPLTPGVLLNRALMLEQGGALAAAAAALGTYLARLPGDDFARVRRSHLLRQLGEFGAALTEAQAAVAARSQHPEPHLAEALAWEALDEGARALAACARGLQVAADFLPAWRVQVEILLDLGELPAARRALAEVVARQPDHPQTHLLRARVAAEAGERTEAFAALARFDEESAETPDGYYRRGLVLLRLGEYAQAEVAFADYITRLPQAFEGYEQLCLCHLARQAWPAALAAGQTAVACQPNNPRFHYYLLLAHLGAGDPQAARAVGERILTLAAGQDPFLLRTYLALMPVLSEPERVSWLERACAGGTDTRILLQALLADAYLDAGQPAKALPVAVAVCDREPASSYHFLLGVRALRALGRLPEAIQWAARGVDHLPADARLRGAYALVLRDGGHFAKALEELAHAAAIAPDDPLIPRQQALVLAAEGQVDEAITLLAGARARGVTDAESAYWQAYLLVHAGRPAEALPLIERSLAEHATPEAQLVRAAALRGVRRVWESQAEIAAVGLQAPDTLVRSRADPVLGEYLSRPANPLPVVWGVVRTWWSRRRAFR